MQKVLHRCSGGGPAAGVVTPAPVRFLSLPAGHVHRGGREVLPSRAGSGARSFAQPGNHIQGSQTGEVRVAQLRQGTESFSSVPSL